METGIHAKARFIPQSAQKVRLVADMIRGKHVIEAQNLLKFTPNSAAKPV